jgi:hypothetical protein
MSGSGAMGVTMILNEILEVANVNNIIDRAALVLLTSYLLRRMLAAPMGNNYAIHEAHVVTADIWRWSIRLCFSLLIWSAGALVITLGVNLWRDHHLVIGVWVMVAGSVLTVGGNLDLIRVLSLRRFGEQVWLWVLMFNWAYTIIALSHLL